jgi:predicted secreted acid phosphatase
MSRLSHHLRRFRSIPVAAAFAVAASLAVPVAFAVGDHHAPNVPPPPAVPARAAQIQNIDQVKTAIKGYYGDTVSDQVDPVPNDIDGGDVALHFSSPTSSYHAEMHRLVTRAKAYLDRKARRAHFGHKDPAIVLDVDDTTLNTYSYEIYSNFVYNPTTNAAFVNAGVFPAVFFMPSLVRRAEHDGYTIFYLTGRPEAQRAGTVNNLVSAGYAAPDAAHLFMRNKDANAPAYLPCDATPPYCTTDQYKSMTRAHIESLGYQIVDNFGDQYSDLSFDHEKRATKLPNPMYFLP